MAKQPRQPQQTKKNRPQQVGGQKRGKDASEDRLKTTSDEDGDFGHDEDE